MIHDIDLVHSLVGGTVVDVQAVGVARAHTARGHRQCAPHVRQWRGREHQRQPHLARSDADDSHLPAGAHISRSTSAAGSGSLLRVREGLDLAALATAPLALEQFVESIPLVAEEGEPLRLEFESFLAAVRGEAPVAVTGEEGRDALAVALQIVEEIERSLRKAVREILFVAGEVSGELHASGVARELVAAGAPFRLVGVGGDRDARCRRRADRTRRQSLASWVSSSR